MLLQYFRESGKNRMEEAISEELNNVVGHLKKVDFSFALKLLFLLNLKGTGTPSENADTYFIYS